MKDKRDQDKCLDTENHNIPEMSVTELAGAVKRTLENGFGQVRVRGELSRVKIHSSGHLYSDLKDADCVINIVCWRTSLARLAIRPEEGLEVVCTGRLTSYPARSSYQLVVERMELAGEGALLKMLEDRRKRLAAEGLFAPERKRAIPYLPKVIGVVTSPTGAVIQDILHRLAERCPTHVIVWPVRVQGEGAAAEIAAAIDGFSSLPENNIPRPDVVIVARGGGSLEDLMPFNEEIVVRAAANSAIPLISAVGHETDTTLIDYAADLRAPTPTAAAEKAVPRREDLIVMLDDRQNTMIHALTRHIRECRHHLEATAAPLVNPARLLENRQQTLDHLSDRLVGAPRIILERLSARIAEMSAKLRHPRDILAESARNVTQLASRLLPAVQRGLQGFEKDLQRETRILETLSVDRVLERGFVLVEKQDGHLASMADALDKGEAVSLRFAGGKRRKAEIQD